MNDPDKTLYNYMLRPQSFWPNTHQRNAVKLQRLIDKGSEGRPRVSYIEDLFSLAKLRAPFNPMHVYIVNMGSSGSHWIESMLGLLPGFYNGGEIYLPKLLSDQLSELTAPESFRLIDALYLAHLGGIRSDFLTAKISNSAHIAKHHVLSNSSCGNKAVLLLRNPINIVLSRTFRKDEYRNDIAAGSKDEDYLERNCQYVERFVQNLDFDSFDLILRYEDFEAAPAENLTRLADVLGINSDRELVHNAVGCASKDSVAKAIKMGGRAINNVYLGQKNENQQAREYVLARLADVCTQTGY